MFVFDEAIFQGRHAAAEGAEAPVDSSSPFVADVGAFGQFLTGLPRLSREQRDSFEAPFSLAELEAAVKQATSRCAPGLDELPYKFY